MAASTKFIVSCEDDEAYKAVVMTAPKNTLCVVDVYCEWCGPCDALQRKQQILYSDMADFDIRFVQAASDTIESLAEFAEPARSKPLFLFVKGGSQVGKIDGADPVELAKLVTKFASKKE